MSSVKSDIKLGTFLTLESTMVNFRPANAKKAGVTVVSADDGTGTILVQGGDSASDKSGLTILDESGSPVVRITKGTGVSNSFLSGTRVYLDGSCGNLTLGGNNEDGDIVLRNHNNEVTAHISGQVGRDSNTVPMLLHPNARLKIDAGRGTFDLSGPFGGRITLRNNARQLKIKLDGNSGLGKMRDLELGEGMSKIGSLLNKITELENRLAALEA